MSELKCKIKKYTGLTFQEGDFNNKVSWSMLTIVNVVFKESLIIMEIEKSRSM